MKIIRFALVLLIIVSFAVTNTAALQFGSDFKYKDSKEMQEDDWSISSTEAITFTGKGIILDGTSQQVTIMYTSIPSGVVDWQVGARCTWLGGSGSSWLDVNVNCAKHSYMFVLNGATSQYELWRDSECVIAVKGYGGAANSEQQIYISKTGGTIEISCNSKALGSYTETDPSAPSIVYITSPSGSKALYSWAGATITLNTPSTGDSSTETPEAVIDMAGEGWESYDVTEIPLNPDTGDGVGIQPNPGDAIDPTTIGDEDPINPPPIPPEEEEPSDEPSDEPSAEPSSAQTDAAASPSPSTEPYERPIWIVVNPCTFSLNTGEPKPDYGASAELGAYIMNGVDKMHNVFTADTETHVHCQQEQALADAGLISPETRINYNPYGGEKPSYYVSMSTHVSGNFSTEATSNAAVASFTVTITDSNGRVVWQNKLTANASEGKSLDYYHCEQAKKADTWLQNEVNRKITK